MENCFSDFLLAKQTVLNILYTTIKMHAIYILISQFAEEVGVKRPLMAPRRKVARPDLTTRLKNKPPCRAFCKPCCYVFGALTVLIGKCLY